MQKILISGASGFVGRALSSHLSELGYQVISLSRQRNPKLINTFYWDPKNKQIDPEALRDVDAVIHLAGAGVADKRWTKSRKAEILSSRTDGLELIYDNLDHSRKIRIISASAVGYYGSSTTDRVYDEDDSHGGDFLSQVCVRWEDAAFRFASQGHSVAVVRTGIVLGRGGALKKMIPAFKLGLGSAIATGRQYMSWIHIDDLVGIYLHLLKNTELIGAYNGVSPEIISNKGFSKKLAAALGKPFFMPPIPLFILKIIFGKMHIILSEGSKISAEKIQAKGYRFQYTKLEIALLSII